MQAAAATAENKPEVLLVDDVRQQGEMVKSRIGEGYEVSSPQSPEELRESILFKIFEAALIDIRWSGENWKTPIVLGSNGHEINDGIDFARFVFELTPRMGSAGAVALYSSLPFEDDPQIWNRIKRLPYHPTTIEKPLPVRPEEVAREFGPLLKAADDLHRQNPLLQPPTFVSQPLPARLRTYKRVNSLYSKWLDFNFESTRDYSWAMVSGLNVRRDCYGVPINGGFNRYGIEPLDSYPSEQRLNDIAAATNFFPFIFWNARHFDFLAPLFEWAGRQLANIPSPWRSFFGIAVSQQCAKSYLEGHEDQVLGWCERLDDVGKVEVAKQIYKSLRTNSPRDLERFAAGCRARELPIIEDVLRGKVDRVYSELGVAKVVLETLDDESLVETLPLVRLTKAGIEFEDTWFEYSVYEGRRAQVIALIEPIDRDEENL